MAAPAKWWLYHIVMVPWHTPPQANRLRGRWRFAASRRAKLGHLGVAVHAVQRLMEADDPVRAHVAQEPHHRLRLPLRGRFRARLVVTVEVPPSVGVVPVEVDSTAVLAGVAGQPVRVVRRDHPQVEATDGLAVPQRPEDLSRSRLVAVHARDDDGFGLARLAQVVGADRATPRRSAEHPPADHGVARSALRAPPGPVRRRPVRPPVRPGPRLGVGRAGCSRGGRTQGEPLFA